ncbi:unnamed protein product [Gadus morhua 'NCC']
MLDFDSDTLFIGKLKTISTETAIKELLNAYDPDATPDRNVELLGKSATIKLPTLKAAAELLCSLHEDYPQPAKEIPASKAKNKELIAADIVRFIRRCRESKCLKCSSDYIPFSSTNTGSAVTCHFCHNPSHLGCYSDSVLDLEAGVVYLCPCCLGSQIAPEHVAPPPVLIAATIAAEHAAGSEHAHHQPVITEHPNTEAVRNPTVNGNDRTGKTDSKKKKPCYDRSKAVCPLLLEGNCSHGISGKNCTSYHPPWCSRFQYNAAPVPASPSGSVPVSPSGSLPPAQPSVRRNLPISNSFLLNIQGMNPGTANQRWKIKALKECIESNPIHTPFFILTETHLKSYHLDAEVHIPDYTCYRADRVSREPPVRVAEPPSTSTTPSQQKNPRFSPTPTANLLASTAKK